MYAAASRADMWHFRLQLCIKLYLTGLVWADIQAAIPGEPGELLTSDQFHLQIWDEWGHLLRKTSVVKSVMGINVSLHKGGIQMRGLRLIFLFIFLFFVHTPAAANMFVSR